MSYCERAGGRTIDPIHIVLTPWPGRVMKGARILIASPASLKSQIASSTMMIRSMQSILAVATARLQDRPQNHRGRRKDDDGVLSRGRNDGGFENARDAGCEIDAVGRPNRNSVV